MAKAPKLANQPQVVTANHLATGDVVYLTKVASWSREIGEASVVPNSEAGAALLAVAVAQAKMNIVVDPYLIPVDTMVAPPRPIQFRERIRALGPTTLGPSDPGPSALGPSALGPTALGAATTATESRHVQI